MHDIRLIASDMDGTLFNSKHEISDRNAAAILAAQQKGVIFTLCTGRISQYGALHINDKGISCPVIGGNGGAIWDDTKKEIISMHPIEADLAMEVDELLYRYGVLYYAFLPDNIVSSDEKINHPNASWKDGAMTKAYGIPFGGGREKMRNAVENEQPFKFYVARQSDDIYDNLLAELKLIKGIYVTSAGKNSIEIMKDGVNKCSGVEELAAMHGIDMKNVMTLGDYNNDMPMIRAAGLGVAMGNALDEVKACADYVTDTNDNDGVAKAIEKFVL